LEILVAQLEEFVNDLKSASEITRLRILALLSLGELSVKDITQILAQSQPRISRHLKLLVNSGLVARYSEGAHAYFGISGDSEKSNLVYSLLSRLDLSDEQLSLDRLQLKSLRETQLKKSTDYFSRIANDWDLVRNMYVSEDLVEDEILSLIGKDMRDMVVDLGTGTARMLELLEKNYKRAIGLDFNKEMINAARSKLIKTGIIHAQIRLGNINMLDEYEGVANLAIMHQVLHYFDDPAKILFSAKRVLEAGGEMLIVDFAPHEFEFLAVEHEHRRLGISNEQMQIWSKKAGLSVEKFKQIPNDKDASGLTVNLWLLKNNNI
jgi:ArsR family transcriptional regulator